MSDGLLGSGCFCGGGVGAGRSFSGTGSGLGSGAGAGKLGVDVGAEAFVLAKGISTTTVPLLDGFNSKSRRSLESTTIRVTAGCALKRETRNSLTGPRLTGMWRFAPFSSDPGKSKISRSGLDARADVGTTGAVTAIVMVRPPGRELTSIFPTLAVAVETEVAACGFCAGWAST